MRLWTTQVWRRCAAPIAALGVGCSVDLAPLERPDASVGGSGGTAGSVTGGSAGAAGAGGGGQPPNPIPASCAEAVTAKSSFGCEFWPTVTPNIVWSIFDFAVIVTNPQTTPVDVSVVRGGAFSVSEQIPAASAKIIHLPWVSSLKGGDTDSCGSNADGGPSVRVDDGAYVLTSSLPVGVTQHSPVEATALGGPSGKSWSSCPGYKCSQSNLGCFAASTDSSLLLPTTSLGTSYRVVGAPGWVEAGIGANATVTATADGTQLSVVLSLTATVLAGGGLDAKPEGSTFQVTLNKADVLVLMAGSKADLSGTLVSATKPIQIVSGIACTDIPTGKSACDHLEEVLPPASALGTKYVVTAPLGPKPGTSVHRVRLVGHVDGTELSYPGGAPANAPASLSAGQLADLGLVTKDFVVEANKPFAVSSFIPGSEVLNGGTAENQLGDPALRLVVPVSRYRTAYSVVAAPNYASSYFELIVPDGASVKLDGAPVSGSPRAIGTSGFSVWFVPTSATTATAHSLTSDVPFGVQVVGFDRYTAYAHAGGMNVGATP